MTPNKKFTLRCALMSPPRLPTIWQKPQSDRDFYFLTFKHLPKNCCRSTWNTYLEPFDDPLFWLEFGSCFGGLTFKNRGQLGSRYMYILVFSIPIMRSCQMCFTSRHGTIFTRDPHLTHQQHGIQDGTRTTRALFLSIRTFYLDPHTCSTLDTGTCGICDGKRKAKTAETLKLQGFEMMITC